MSSPTEKYVYGVALADLRLPRCRGIGGGKVSLLADGPLAAVVGDVEPPVIAGKDELSAHARVLQSVLERGPVLPMRFGMMVPDEQGVRDELLGPFTVELLEQLHALEGSVELHLRASYEERALMSEVIAADPRIGELSAALRGQSSDATYYLRIELGQRVAEEAGRVAARDRDQILSELEPLCTAVSAGETQHELIACDAAFLIERAAIDDFDHTVDELGRRNDGRLRFSYSGPHPPYNFVELPVQV